MNMSLENITQQINYEKVRLSKTNEFNDCFKNFNLSTFIEPEYNNLILYATNTEKPIIKVSDNAINNTQSILDKITKLEPMFESIKNFVNHISHGTIYLNHNEFTFIYKNTILVKIKYIDEKTLKIESNFKIEQGAIHLQLGKGKLIVNTDFNANEEITYRIEKQITPKELNTTILDEMNEETINIFQKNLNININDYPQSKHTFF